MWDALGDVPHYVEPFFGSGAVLFGRPHVANRPYFSETVNDLDGLLVNAWRSIQWHPQATAEAASWPVSEFDKHARGCTLLAWRDTEAAAHLAGDPTWCDPVMGGWWLWCVSVTIGAWGAGGPWSPDDTGRLRKQGRGVRGDLPHLGDNGQGVNRPQTREQGVSAALPHLGDDGKGVNHAGTREPGVTGDHVTDDYLATGGYHPLTMPELRRWFAYLSARLRHVRIINGDWARVVTSGAALTLPVRQGKGPAGIFLDPPYGDVGRASLYGRHETFDVATEVRQWAATRAHDPKWRIVCAGYAGEGDDLVADGWREIEWFKTGFLKGGMGNVDTTNGHQQHRERLWLSPHCLNPAADNTQGLW